MGIGFPPVCVYLDHVDFIPVALYFTSNPATKAPRKARRGFVFTRSTRHVPPTPKLRQNIFTLGRKRRKPVGAKRELGILNYGFWMEEMKV
jgi:hypothetical protein